VSVAPPPPNGVAVLYSRAHCGPCYALRRSAARAARRAGLPLVVVDIDSDPVLASRYGTEVPVLILPGGRTLSGRVLPGEVDAAFRAVVAGTAGCRPVAALPGRVVTWALRRLRRLMEGSR
jgi:hypothetical protein